MWSHSRAKVKDRTEKQEILPTPKRNPRGEMTFDKREIKHVYHFTVQKRRIASFGREKRGDLIMAVTENHPIKETVENISDRSAEN